MNRYRFRDQTRTGAESKKRPFRQLLTAFGPFNS